VSIQCEAKKKKGEGIFGASNGAELQKIKQGKQTCTTDQENPPATSLASWQHSYSNLLKKSFEEKKLPHSTYRIRTYAKQAFGIRVPKAPAPSPGTAGSGKEKGNKL